MLNRAYSLLTVKSVDDEKRVIEGIATTPEVDRVGDVVEPLGARFKNPIRLLLFHDSERPVGTVRLHKPTKEGITFTASLPRIEDPPHLRDRIEEAWQSARHGLLGGTSIGFRPEDGGVELMKSGGYRFTDYEIVELSLVTIPAQASATIQAIKSLDAPHLAALGTGAEASPAGVPAIRRAISLRKATTPTVTYTEQIAAFEAKRAAHEARMSEIQKKASDDSRSKNEQEKEEFDTLNSELSGIDSELVDLRMMEQRNRSAAVAVHGKTPEQSAAARDGKSVQVKVESRMPDGLEFAAMVLCKAQAFIELQKGNLVSPVDIAKQRYPDYPRIHASLVRKTAVAAGTTTDTNFAASLLPAASTLEGEFLAYLRPKTLVDRFGTNGIPSLKRVPFNVKIQSQTSGASAGWVGEGKGKPVTRFNITDATLLPTKIAAISVITEELARFSRPGAEGIVRDELARAVIERMDRDFVDPAKAAVSGVNPASITNGVTALSSAGVSAANVLTDIQALVAPFVLNGYDISQLVLLMPNTLALTTSLMQNSLGQDSFKGMTIQGGTLAGIPVLASQYLASGASYGNMIICLSAENIALADDGSVTVDASREASIEMSDAPTNEAVTPTANAYMVSMFQTNSIALRAEREIGWKKLRSTAVTYMDDVNWGSIGSPF